MCIHACPKILFILATSKRKLDCRKNCEDGYLWRRRKSGRRVGNLGWNLVTEIPNSSMQPTKSETTRPYLSAHLKTLVQGFP